MAEFHDFQGWLRNLFLKKKSVTPAPQEITVHKGPLEAIHERYGDIQAPESVTILSSTDPFNLHPYQVLYMEGEYDPVCHEFFRGHKDTVSHMLSDISSYCKWDPKLVYFPALWDDLREKGPGPVTDYYFPFMSADEQERFIAETGTMDTAYFSRIILKGLGYEGAMHPGLLRRRKERDPEGNYRFSYVNLSSSNIADLEKKLWFYFSHAGEREESVYYQLSSDRSTVSEGSFDNYSDNCFDYENRKLAIEIAEKIEKLRLSGNSHLLMTLLGNHRAVPVSQSGKPINGLSRLIIDPSYRLFLPDYHDLEIIMTPLPKTVFLFFLRHPEGVMLKFLSDHREELLAIYKLLASRESLDDLVSSVDDLTNPISNSINEKCSRIKETFLAHFEERLAVNYYITGPRGREKGIRLNRELVTWQSILPQLPPLVQARTAQSAAEVAARVTALFRAAMADFKAKSYPAAIEQFSRVIESDPYHYQALVHRAIAWFQLGDYRQALADNDRAIRINPEVDVAHHNRAEDKLMLKDYAGALEDITIYLRKVNNRCAASYHMRGLVKMEMNDLMGACQDWFTAAHLGHTEARKYLKKHKKFTPGEPCFELGIRREATSRYL